jgi:hypothetical protein
VTGTTTDYKWPPEKLIGSAGLHLERAAGPYSLGNTVLPGPLLRVPEVELDSPERPDVTVNSVAADASTEG